jgi:hypothetical protein
MDSRLGGHGVTQPDRAAARNTSLTRKTSRGAPPDPFGDVAAPPLRLKPLYSPLQTPASDARSSQVIMTLKPSPIFDPQDDPEPSTEIIEDKDALSALWRGGTPTSSMTTHASRTDRSQLGWAFGIGMFLAALIVALAVVFRPTPGETASQPDVSDISTAPLRAPTLRTGANAVLNTSVRLRIGAKAPTETENAYRDAIYSAGYKSVEVLVMPFHIDRARIEFFADADQLAAAALARTLASIADGVMEVRNLQNVVGMPQSGHIDAWVAD